MTVAKMLPKDFFLMSMVSGDFCEVEYAVMNLIDSKLCCKKAGGDELATSFWILVRLGTAIGFSMAGQTCRSGSLAIFLLFLATQELQSEVSNLNLAAACLHLADRLANKQTQWPGYLESLSGLAFKDIQSIAERIARIYVDWYNNFNFFC